MHARKLHGSLAPAGKMPAIAALAYHRASGRNISQPNQRLSYSENFLYMLDAANKPGYAPLSSCQCQCRSECIGYWPLQCLSSLPFLLHGLWCKRVAPSGSIFYTGSSTHVGRQAEACMHLDTCSAGSAMPTSGARIA